MFKVKKECCNECLFTENRIVNAKRMREILAGCAINDQHFTCHKATIEGKDICCRGFYDKQTSNMIRIAQRLNAVEFVD